ncbi:MAG: CDP-glucose 4,6-dehydratase [Elusimicrobia bacterium GWA2_56_46]|nr:MAG: CDP-glucose 4,6-dehydratase [Elusimicrobia bacterium GWA2_56_46]OGR53693.1 MAG: CDP-glucose 4,6-dehydratase [Elusimicrobia bacterium GWC2_56_31]HBW23168.1 CDP-glucose 4,6-dehydratase [Elusimicrobiota bacterium]
MSANSKTFQTSNSRTFWRGKKVFLTGHTGFKGAWLSLWLDALGAEVTGYALKPPTRPSLFELCRAGRFMNSVIADIRDAARLRKAVLAARPEIIIHMAAQPLVRRSYKDPRETYETNIMGTVNLLEAVGKCASVKAVVNVTTDKCYENKEHLRGYKEDEPLGGYDPYSSSKACSELVTSAYRSSFFNPKSYSASYKPSSLIPHPSSLCHHVALASARAGNVIGGGDWAADRLIPDILGAFLKGRKVLIRNPRAIRPWQYVLEPLGGYLLLAQRLFEKGPAFAESWNFGPEEADARNVEWIVKRMCAKWGKGASYVLDKGRHPHEAHYLKLDCAKARARLGWRPRWHIGTAIDKIIEWTLAYKSKADMRKVCLRQIGEYNAIGHKASE